jgi:DNA-binding LacI/PurR family transcriptional regulator
MNQLYSFKIQNNRESLAAQVASYLKGLIFSGKLKNGEKIPNEAELAEILKVSRTTAREAVMNLVHQGLFHRHVGRGTFVNALTMPNQILWVYGHDVMKEDISLYYNLFLRTFSKECARYGWQVVPKWNLCEDIGQGRETSIKNDNYIGYSFIGCPQTHPLLNSAIEKNYPYVHITASPANSKFVTTDISQGFLLGIEHLKRKNSQSPVIVICSKSYESVINQIINTHPEIKVKVIFINTPLTMSETIQTGYRAMNEIIKTEHDWSSLFIFDDILALGASDAILKLGYDNHKDINLLVRSSVCLQIPFYKPITYLVDDIEEEVINAVRILHEQINGNPFPACYSGKYALIDSEECAIAV